MRKYGFICHYCGLLDFDIITDKSYERKREFIDRRMCFRCMRIYKIVKELVRSDAI